ncbi:MAG: tetratricopeptide repeat protein [Polyangia bacterium]
MLSRQFDRSLSLALLSILSIGGAGSAMAAEAKALSSSDASNKAQNLNRYAMQLFDDGNFALAEKTLLEALGVLEKANLADAPAALATHGNLAVLYSAGLKRPDKAVAEFKKALVIKPDLKLSQQRATPEITANLDRARAELEGGAPPAAVSPPPPRVSGESRRTEVGASLQCPPGGEIAAGDDVHLECLSSDAKISAVLLYYKPNGAEEYRIIAMRKGAASEGVTTWQVTIPGSDTNGTWVPIYFEARSAAGAPLSFSGRPENPSVIRVKGSEQANRVAEEDDDEEGGAGHEDDEEEIDDNNPLARLENERRREREGLKGTWTFWGALGSGVGYATGRPEAFGSGSGGLPSSSGLAPAYLGHFTWDVGYFVGRDTALVVGGRHQWIAGATNGTATGANSALVKLLFFTEREGRIRWYFSTVAGGGEGFRLRVTDSIHDVYGNLKGSVNDTVQGGPGVAGLGGGLVVKLVRRWHFTLDAQALVGIPKPSTVLDLNAGIRWMH